VIAEASQSRNGASWLAQQGELDIAGGVELLHAPNASRDVALARLLSDGDTSLAPKEKQGKEMSLASRLASDSVASEGHLITRNRGQSTQNAADLAHEAGAMTAQSPIHDLLTSPLITGLRAEAGA